MKTILKATAAISLLGLSACESATVKYELVLQPAQSFTLKDTDKKPVSLRAGTQVKSAVSYFANSKKVKITIGEQDVEFKGATYEASSGDFQVLPATSEQTTETGDRVGISGSRRLVCSPNCETTDIREVYESCTFWDWRPIQHCWGGSPGHPGGCTTRWERVAVSGTQLVEETRVTRRYNIEANVFGESSGRLATGYTVVNESNSTYRELSTCR